MLFLIIYSCAVQSLSYNQLVVRMVVGKDAVVRKVFNHQILINQSGLYALTLYVCGDVQRRRYLTCRNGLSTVCSIRFVVEQRIRFGFCVEIVIDVCCVRFVGEYSICCRLSVEVGIDVGSVRFG